MAIKKRIKYQVLIVSVPNATAALQLVEANIKLDSDFAFCTGVAFNIGLPGTIANPSLYVDVGLRDAGGTIHDDCHHEQWQASAAVNPNDKFKSILVALNGQNIFARITPPSLTTAINTFQFTFRLEDDYEVIAAVR